MSDDPNDLVTLTTTGSEFEAHTLVALLADYDIPAFAFAAAHRALPLELKQLRIPVQVRASDLAEARDIISERVSDSVDLDWNEIDVGERSEQEHTSKRRRMPIIVRLGMFVGWLVLLLMAIGVVLFLVMFITG